MPKTFGTPCIYIIQGAHKVWVHRNFTILFIYVVFHPHGFGRRGHVEWSPRSPDLFLVDFFFWGMLKEKVFSMKVANLNHLIERIISQCTEIDGNVDLFNRVHPNFSRRFKLCIKNNGNHIENLIF